jgi:uncharacterized membrane protein
VYAILAYIGILVLVPIFAAKESRFARYHANQGLVLAIAGVAWGIVASILSTVLVAGMVRSGAFGVGTLISSLFGLVWIAFLVFAIMGIVNAAQGKFKPLPLIGTITILK